jgi:hypothetical protein
LIFHLYPNNLKTLAFWQSIFCKKTLSRASDSQSYRERGTVFSCEKDEAKTSVFRLFGYIMITPSCLGASLRWHDRGL